MMLLQSVVAIGVLGMVGLISAKQDVIRMKRTQKLEQKNDINMIKTLIFEGMDRKKTLEVAGITKDNRQSMCNTNSGMYEQENGTFLRMVRKTSDGSIKYLTDPLQTSGIHKGSAKIGKWWVRVTCSVDEGFYVVRIARVNVETNTFNKDPLNKNITQDFYNHHNALISGIGHFPVSIYTDNNRPQLAVLDNFEASRSSGSQDYNSQPEGNTTTKIDITKYPGAQYINFTFNCNTAFESSGAQSQSNSFAKNSAVFLNESGGVVYSVNGCEAGNSNNIHNDQDEKLVPIPRAGVEVVLYNETKVGSTTPKSLISKTLVTIMN